MTNGNNTVTYIYRNFRNFDGQSFRNDLSSQSLESAHAFCDPNEMWQEWKHTFLAKANKHVPPRTKRVHACSSPWITSGINVTREISNEFDNHFSTIGPKLASEIDSDSGDYQRYLTRTDKRFHLHPIN